jgi:hypothetical protein
MEGEPSVGTVSRWAFFTVGKLGGGESEGYWGKPYLSGRDADFSVRIVPIGDMERDRGEVKGACEGKNELNKKGEADSPLRP